MKNLNKAPSQALISKADINGQLIAEPVLGVIPEDNQKQIEAITHKGGKLIKFTPEGLAKEETLNAKHAAIANDTLNIKYMAYYAQGGFSGYTAAHQAVKDQAYLDFPVDPANPKHHVGGDINAEVLKPSQIAGVKARMKTAGRASLEMNYREVSAKHATKPKAKKVEAEDNAAIALQAANLKKFAEAYATPDHGFTPEQLTAGIAFLAALVVRAEKITGQVNPAIEEKEVNGHPAKVHKMLK